MIKSMKALIGLALREDATVGELTPSLPAAEEELAAARSAQAEAEAAYRSSLLSAGEANLRALDTARREATVRIDKAEALVAAFKDRMAEAREREAEAERVERYEAARRQGDGAADALRELYPTYAGGLVELLKIVAEAEIAVAEANDDLPRGALRLAGVEGRVRNTPGLPEEIVSEAQVERWVRLGQTVPGNFEQADVWPTDGNRGVLQVRGMAKGDGYPVELRVFTERQVLPATYSGGVDPLAHTVSLPGFVEDAPMLFEPVERPYQGAFDPIRVLAKIFELRGKAPHGEPARAIKTTLIPVDETPVRQ